MQDRRNTEVVDPATHPLKTLTRDQFMALGGTAVVFSRPISGLDLMAMLKQPGFENEDIYQLVMSADGTPLFVGDSIDTVTEWLAEAGHGIVQLH